MDALAKVCNEETHLQDADHLRFSSVLATHSSFACPAAPVPPTSPPVASSAILGASIGLHCDHYGQDN
jgi:hypothetical protein